MAKPPTPLGITWTEIERRLLKGMSAREIAEELGCSVQNVHYRIRARQRALERQEPAGTASSGGVGA